MAVNFNDYIFVKSGKQTQKRYKVNCDNCSKDRGYLQLVLSGKKATSHLCVSCKNATKQTANTNYFCNFCNSEKMLPLSIGESDNHWFWDKNQNLKLGGSWRCRIMMKNKNTKWMNLNPEKYKLKQTKSSKIYRSTEQGRLRSNISARMAYLLSKRGRNDAANISKLPWTVEELMTHLELLFEPGMTWENYGRDGWHVDHAVPDSWFEYSSVNDEGFIKSWSLSNLKPMWAKDNLSKSNRYAE